MKNDAGLDPDLLRLFDAAPAVDNDAAFVSATLVRLEKARPLLEQLKVEILAARGGALPKSAFAKACDYTLTLWNRLSRFLPPKLGPGLALCQFLQRAQPGGSHY